MDVPTDLEAEATVVGCSIASAHGYLLAAGRLHERHFYRLRHRQLFEACAELTNLVGGSDDVREGRIGRASRLAGVTVDEVRRIVDERSVQCDTSGSYAARVLRAYEKRRLMAAAAELYNRVGQGEPLELVLATSPLSLAV